MFFKNGDSFEALVFGRYFVGDRDYVKYQSFSQSMRDQIEQEDDSPYPGTRLGALLYFGVYEELKRRGVNPDGLRLKSSRGSELDIHHFADGYYRLFDDLVTVDLFNLDSEICKILRDRWEVYGDESDFQTKLFQYKKGMVDFWERGGSKIEHWEHVFCPPEFASSKLRPENHFVLTPYHTESRQRRKGFARMVARYFLKASSQNMAKQSH